MKVLVTGGRDYNNSFNVDMVLATLTFSLSEEEMTLIVGDATGADTIARKAAESLDWEVEVYEADWEKYGKQAGPIRNGWMINIGEPDVCLAFPGGKGTANCVMQAEAAGIPVYNVSDGRGVYQLLSDHRKKMNAGGET